jgi:hypothetical protein
LRETSEWYLNREIGKAFNAGYAAAPGAVKRGRILKVRWAVRREWFIR